VTADGRAALVWDSVTGADSYIVVRDGQPGRPLRIEGSQKQWTDSMSNVGNSD
jgi:hypothetical protein